MVAAKVGEYVAFDGDCFRWTGSGWELLDPENTANTDYYMRSLRDLDEKPGKFSVVLAKEIMAMEATIETLEGEILRLRDPKNKNNFIELNGKQGILKSSNYNPAKKTGWQIDNEKIEINDGNLDNITINQTCTVKELNGTTLNAQTLTMNGQHTAGTGNVIVSNNDRKETVGGNEFSLVSEGLIKRLRVIGRGVVTVRHYSRGSVRIFLNEAVGIPQSNPSFNASLQTWQEFNVNLANDINIISLRGLNGAGTFLNTTFEVCCGNNPGLFKLLSFPL